MIILIEGIDRVGKTTLCNLLHNEINYPIYRHVGERNYKTIDNDVETDKFYQVLELCKLTYSSMIFDRFHLSDYVYGVIERHYDINKANKNFESIEKFAEENLKDAILLLVLPTDIKRSSEEHGKDLTEYNDLFLEKYKNSKIKYKFQCSYNTLNEAVLFVRTVLNKEL